MTTTSKTTDITKHYEMTCMGKIQTSMVIRGPSAEHCDRAFEQMNGEWIDEINYVSDMKFNSLCGWAKERDEAKDCKILEADIGFTAVEDIHYDSIDTWQRAVRRKLDLMWAASPDCPSTKLKVIATWLAEQL